MNKQTGVRGWVGAAAVFAAAAIVWVAFLVRFALADSADMKVNLPVPTASSLMVAANKDRLYLRLVNAGTGVVTCRPNAAAAAAQAYVLAASGGNVEFVRAEQARRAYYCIGAAASTLAYDEITRDNALTAPSPTPVPTP